MNNDLREQIAQVLPPDLARQLAATVGLDEGQGPAFVETAIPMLLAALRESLDGGGAQALSDMVSNSDPNTLERLRRALIQRDLGPLNAGANALSPVLGQAARDRLANTLADKFEAPIEAAMPALGAVGQAAVAVIGQLDPSLWSDAASIRTLLSAGSAAAAPPPPPRPAPRMEPSSPPPAPATSGGGATWIIVLIVIVVIAAGGYWWWMQSHPKPAAGFLSPASQHASTTDARS